MLTQSMFRLFHYDKPSPIDATRLTNSPIQSPGMLMQQQIRQQKQINSSVAVSADSPLFKGKLEQVDSIVNLNQIINTQSIGTPTKKINQFQPSNKTIQICQNNPLKKYAKKD